MLHILTDNTLYNKLSALGWTLHQFFLNPGDVNSYTFYWINLTYVIIPLLPPLWETRKKGKRYPSCWFVSLLPHTQKISSCLKFHFWRKFTFLLIPRWGGAMSSTFFYLTKTGTYWYTFQSKPASYLDLLKPGGCFQQEKNEVSWETMRGHALEYITPR
jgi:hypothetical protein